MNFRQFAKTGVYYARHAGVRALAVPRALPWVRHRLHLPANAPLDPLDATPADGISVRVLDEGRAFLRPLPDLPLDPAAFDFFASRAEEPACAGYVVTLPGGSFWSCDTGAVFSGQGRFIPSLSRDPWGPRLHAVWTQMRLPAPERLPGRVLYLVTPEAEDNFHHWMIDLLPRIGLALRAGCAPAGFDHIVLPHRGRRYQLESLARLGVPLDRIREIAPGRHLRADELVVPSLKPINQSLPAADAGFLRDVFLGARPPEPSGRRIYLSRGEAAFRRLDNEAGVASLFARQGFEIVTPAALTLAEQARLVAGASWIAGPAGAAFANLVFAPASARVLELAPPSWLSVYHWMVSARRGCRHTILLGEGECRPGLPEIGGRRRNFTVSLEKLAGWLRANLPAAAAVPSSP